MLHEYRTADPNSVSHFHDILTRHTDIDLSINFERNVMRGSTIIECVVVGSKPARWELRPRSEPNGSPLQIEFETTPESTGLQWFSTAQTEDKQRPFMCFKSRNESLHARPIVPCQDTPSLKSTCRGVPQHKLVFPPLETILSTKHYVFIQDVPISNYLFAVASGLKLIFGYPWPLYNPVTLPKLFYLGGMEDPIFNFYSVSVISGDCETFSGNLVNNASWEHFWLNEGWTVYIERLILPEQELACGLDSYGGDDSPDTRMVLNFCRKQPDDIISTIVYKKGYPFLRRLEETVGRPKWLPFGVSAPFMLFIPYVQSGFQYFTEFPKNSVDPTQFKETMFELFVLDTEATARLDLVDWAMWCYKPGAIPEPVFVSPLFDEFQRLADKWNSISDGPSHKLRANDMQGWKLGQSLVFLDELIRRPNTLSQELVSAIGSEYGWANSSNLEVLKRYLRVAVRAAYRSVLSQTEDVLGQTGRMKLVRPL
ncbi:hypothetical protein B0J13DRAFT_586293 [Dactylonectria estremocensis]|uniref:Peptidase M1 leukotriene A4 hydrolase/aminopeptidase C-terminal domain-containing protein n=1 Tax=Dactylonectria estremocensis TaxID=1079267 RepID=A0A9P9J2I2_9HYPO|nr:hypothetical protein B0J13DRAFT_586293 [Dactylonectria estremocensis]